MLRQEEEDDKTYILSHGSKAGYVAGSVIDGRKLW